MIDFTNMTEEELLWRFFAMRKPTLDDDRTDFDNCLKALSAKGVQVDKTLQLRQEARNKLYSAD